MRSHYYAQEPLHVYVFEQFALDYMVLVCAVPARCVVNKSDMVSHSTCHSPIFHDNYIFLDALRGCLLTALAHEYMGSQAMANMHNCW